jgi:hypothetical protein
MRVAPSELGIYPAVDPLSSTSKILSPRIVGEEQYGVARGPGDPAEVRGPLGHHRPKDGGKLLVVTLSGVAPADCNRFEALAIESFFVVLESHQIRSSLCRQPQLQRPEV